MIEVNYQFYKSMFKTEEMWRFEDLKKIRKIWKKMEKSGKIRENPETG